MCLSRVLPGRWERHHPTPENPARNQGQTKSTGPILDQDLLSPPQLHEDCRSMQHSPCLCLTLTNPPSCGSGSVHIKTHHLQLVRSGGAKLSFMKTLLGLATFR